MGSAIQVYPHGASAAWVSGHVPEGLPPRGECGGWSAKSARSNSRFLWSVLQDELTGIGVAGSFTVRECPDSNRDWKALREAFFWRQRQRGLLRLHWLTEFQRRGVPHLHFSAYFANERPGDPVRDHFLAPALKADWLELAGSRFGAQVWGQDAKPIDSVQGWLEYVAKHGARGAAHYQRSQESLPAGWHGVTGRMWGKLGEWPTDEPMGFDLEPRAFYAYRRIVRAQRIADARSLRNPARRARAIRAARRTLLNPDPKASRCRGVSGWIDRSSVLRVFDLLASCGFQIAC